MNLYESGLLKGIDTVIIRVSNYENSKNWYEEKLGLSPIWDDPAMKLVVLDTKSPVSITLWQTEKKINVEEDTAAYPIFRTGNAHALHEELKKLKVRTSEIIKDDHVTWFKFYDPDGNVLEACQPNE